MNTQNPVVHVVAHMDTDRRRVAFLPITGGSHDLLGVPVVQSLFTGKTIPEGQMDIISTIDSLRQSSYADADFVLVAWDAQRLLNETKHAIPALSALIGGKVVDMHSLALAFADLPTNSPYRFVRPDEGLALSDAVMDVYELYCNNINHLSVAYESIRSGEPASTSGDGGTIEVAHPALLGIGGWKAAGQDTFAGFLGDDWVVIGMSERLYEALLKVNPSIVCPIGEGDNVEVMKLSTYLKDVCKGDWAKAKRLQEVRSLLQSLGTDVVREMIDEDAWVEMMRVRVRQLHAQGKNVAVTGIRFPNELNAIKEMGGSTAWVQGASGRNTDTHTSEVSLAEADFDFAVYNTGTIEDLKGTAAQIADMLTSPRSQ